MIKFGFPHCTVTVYKDRIVTTHIEDGSQSIMRPPVHHTSYRDIARSFGYEDPFVYAVEHEIGHQLVADELGWPCSWSVWSSAHGMAFSGDGRPRKMSRAVAYDEHLTNALQRYMRLKEVDGQGRLKIAFRERLDEVADRLRQLCERVDYKLLGYTL